MHPLFGAEILNNPRTAMKSELLSYDPGDGWSVSESSNLDSEATLVVAFVSPSQCENLEAIAWLRSRYPQSVLIGCSTSGEFLGSELRDDSISALVVKFDSTSIRKASVEISDPSQTQEAAGRLAQMLVGDDLAGVFILSDGLKVNGSALVRGLSENLPLGVKLTGGLAGDHTRFEQTFVIDDGELICGRIVAVGFYGDKVQVESRSQAGWDKFGLERTITRSEGNILYELDDQPALDVYREYLGEKARELPASALIFPIAVWDPNSTRCPVVRTVLSVDEATKSMTFAGDVQEGCLAQLLYANADRLIDSAGVAGYGPLQLEPTTQVAIGVSCVGRRMVLMDRTDEEVEAVFENLPPDTPFIGYYSYGEIGSLPCGPSELHNQTMTVTHISEAA